MGSVGAQFRLCCLQWAPNSQSQQTFGATNSANTQQTWAPHYTGATSQVRQTALLHQLGSDRGMFMS